MTQNCQVAALLCTAADLIEWDADKGWSYTDLGAYQRDVMEPVFRLSPALKMEFVEGLEALLAPSAEHPVP
jgi:hypothetical protein